MDKQPTTDSAVASAPAGSAVRRAAPRKEDWIGNQLRKVYEEALHEEIPPDMLKLLEQLDEPDPEEGERK